MRKKYATKYSKAYIPRSCSHALNNQVKGKVVSYMEFEKVSKLNVDEYINKVGDLYNFDEVPTAVANRVEDMTKLQDDLSELLEEVVTLREGYKMQTEEITNLKQTNTKLMYDSIRRNPKPKKENVEQEELENAERLAQEIDIYD